MKRPGGWIDGIGWVAALHDTDGCAVADDVHQAGCSPEGWDYYTFPMTRSVHPNKPVIVVRWADGTVPAPSPEGTEA